VSAGTRHRDAWYDAGSAGSVKAGYETSFIRYFYKPTPLSTLEGILAFINKTHFDRITMILRSAGNRCPEQH
jgi:hypothetical protein